MFTRSVSPEAAPDQPTYITIDFEAGDPVAIDGVKYTPAQILTKLNELGGANGIGRLDLVESRFVGMKVSRKIYNMQILWQQCEWHISGLATRSRP